MKSLAVYTFLLLIVALTGCSPNANPAFTAPTTIPGSLRVELAYLNHPPVMVILQQQVDPLLQGYGTKIDVIRYDLETPDGAAFIKQKGVIGHMPIAIFINGSDEATINGRKIQFLSFPQNQGTGMVPSGAWTVDDLKAALDQAVSK
jgi:hypothetical protein